LIARENKQYTAFMRDSQPNHYFGLDIGTSMVRCVVGMDNPDNPLQPSIIGYGAAPNNGIRKGVIVHVEDVVDSIIQAVNEAERISGINIHKVTTNINGASVVGINSEGVIAVSAANREITAEDSIRVEEAATILQLPSNKEIIQVFAKNYRLDGQENIKDPVGMHGIRLEVESHIITASTPSLKNLYSALEASKLGINHLTTSGLAGAEAVLTRQQKESGTLLLDIGASTTNLAVLEDGEIQHIAVIPVGGINVTNDLAIGLRVDLDLADQVKLRYANLKTDRQKSWESEIKYKGEEYSFATTEIQMIVEARLEELLDFVEKELNSIHKSRKLPGGVVIVGGTSKIPGIDSFTRDKLQLPARLGKIEKLHGLVEAVQDTTYTTAVGLMILDMLLGNSDEFGGGFIKSGSNINAITNKLLGRLKRPKS
jgi:cell division protein FtsA